MSERKCDREVLWEEARVERRMQGEIGRPDHVGRTEEAEEEGDREPRRSASRKPPRVEEDCEERQPEDRDADERQEPAGLHRLARVAGEEAVEERDRLNVGRRVLRGRAVRKKRALLLERSLGHPGHERDERRRVRRHSQRVVDDGRPDHQAEKSRQKRENAVAEREIDPGCRYAGRTLGRGLRGRLLLVGDQLGANTIDLDRKSLGPLLGARHRPHPLALPAGGGLQARVG